MNYRPLKYPVLLVLWALACPLSAQAAVLSKNAVVTDEQIKLLEEMHEQAEECILSNDFRGAVRVYDEILLQEPDDEAAYTGMAQCYMVMGDFPRAKQAYENALHINPDNETAQLGLQKIKDPDSMSRVERETITVIDGPLPELPAGPEPGANVIPAPVPAAIPIRYPDEAAASLVKTPPPLSSVPPSVPPGPARQNDVHMGARKTMAEYSVDIPKPLKDLSRNQQIQAALKNAGLYRGPIDGVIGPFTRKAIREFQAKHDLVVDGKPGPKTWELLQPFLDPRDFNVKLLNKS